MKEPNMFHNYETEIIMHDAFNVYVADVCIVHDDLWWKNRTN